MSNYAEHFNPTKTPQNEKAKDGQVKNSAGGYVFKLDCWGMLDRFLILGAETNTYYATEKKLVRDNAKNVLKCLDEDPVRAITRIAEISDSGRAPKNDPAIFALALAASHEKPETRKFALSMLPRVCRIGTHIFQFVSDVSTMRKWSRGLRTAVANWYTTKKDDSLAMQLLKYQQRNGWSHRDLLRLAHPVAETAKQDAMFRWAIGGVEALKAREVKRGKGKKAPSKKYTSRTKYLHPMLEAYEELKTAESDKEVVKLIQKHGYTHEMVPSEKKNSVAVWEALLEDMPPTALLRNLGKMTNVGLFKPLSNANKRATAILSNVEQLKKARVHPISVLLALKVYEQGHGEKGKLTWSPQREIIDALDDAFYTAFQTVVPTGKRTLLAIDISGSMEWVHHQIAGCPGMYPRTAAAAMAMVTAKAEKNWHCFGFTAGSRGVGGMHGGGRTGFTEIPISPKQRLTDIMETMRGMPVGGTDCSLPMIYAMENKLEVDVFQVFTDNETWHGDIHPYQALKAYRADFVHDAKLCVVGFASTGFTIADPSDAGTMDFVGFDSAAPALMADFARGGAL